MRRTHQRPSGTFCVTLEEHALPSRSPDGLDTVLLNERIRCDNGELLQLVAPRAFLLIAGGGSDGEDSRGFIDAAMPAYERQAAREVGRPHRRQ